MSASKLKVIIPSLLTVILLVIACAPSAPPEVRTVKETVVVEKNIEKVVTATAPVPEATTASNVEQTFTVAVSRDSGSFDPRAYEAIIPDMNLIYEGLVHRAADGTIQPALAESWEISGDGLTWTFHLRRGVTFQDGTPFNAQAAKWNFDQWIGTAKHSWLAITKNIESVNAPDDNTLTLHMKQFYYPGLTELALVQPAGFLSPKAVDASGNFTNPIGTGPWKVEEHVADQRTVFVPYENYWGTKPTLKRVVFEVIPDPQTRIAALLSGEVDLIGGEYLGGISLESNPILKRNPNVQVVTAPGSTTYLVMTNFRRAPFDELRVRQALNYAIDRQAISTKLFQGIAVPAQGIFPSTVPYVSYPDAGLYAYKPDQAKSLLEAAGWKAGADGILEKEGKPFKVTMVVDGTGFPQAKSMAEVIQAELKDIGIQMDIRLLDYAGWSDALQKGDYDLGMNISYGAPYDPHGTLNALFHSSTVIANEGLIYADPTLDKMIDQVLATKDQKERAAQYEAIWKYMDQNAVAVPVVYSARFYALRNGVQGFRMSGTEYELDLANVTIASR